MKKKKSIAQITLITIPCAVTVVSALPIMTVYPFLMRFFMMNMVLNSVKG